MLSLCLSLRTPSPNHPHKPCVATHSTGDDSRDVAEGEQQRAGGWVYAFSSLFFFPFALFPLLS